MHSSKIGHLITDHPTGFETYFNKETKGKKYWQQVYNYPDVGVSLVYFNYHNPVIGESVAVIPYWRFYLSNRNSLFSLKLLLGGGLVYNTNPYHKENNFKNNVLSSKVSYSMRLGLITNIKLNSKVSIVPSLILTHFSNGALKMPNKGINIPAFYLGIEYNFKESSISNIQVAEKPEIDKSIHVNTVFSSGFTETSPSGTGRHPFFNFSIYSDKRLNYKSAINSGFDLFINQAKKQDIQNDPDLDSQKTPDYKRMGWTIGHELFLGRMTILTQWGTYIYNPYPSDGSFYQRLGLKYYILNELLFVGVNLKTHFATAEMAEWSLGVRF